jgi:hypothetical protein
MEANGAVDDRRQIHVAVAIEILPTASSWILLIGPTVLNRHDSAAPANENHLLSREGAVMDTTWSAHHDNHSVRVVGAIDRTIAEVTIVHFRV